MLENWLFLALLAPFFWALVNVIDAYFVKGIYKSEYDGTIISGIFQIVPWLLIPILGMGEIKVEGAFLAIFGGFFYMLGTFFYFRSLFSHADAAMVVIIWSTVGVVVPMLEALVFGERLFVMQYFGIAITFAGAVLLSVDPGIRSRKVGKIYANMIFAVAFCSASLILEDKAYEQVSFWNGTLFISLGSFLGGMFFWIIRPGEKNSHLRLTKKYFKIFFVAEALALVGMVVHYKAIDSGPVSLVSAVENVQPVWIMAISLAICLFASLFRLKNVEAIQAMKEDQIASWRMKIVAVAITAFGIYLAS